MLYKPKQYLIEAITGQDALDNIDPKYGDYAMKDGLPEWFCHGLEYGLITPIGPSIHIYNRYTGFRVETNNGFRLLRPVDYILYDHEGEMNVISKREFESKFEEIPSKVCDGSCYSGDPIALCCCPEKR